MGENEEGTSPPKPVPKPIAVVPSTRVDRLLRERIRKSRSAQQLEVEELLSSENVLTSAESNIAERLIVVANRLPVTCSKDSSGKWKLSVSAGGLVSALMGVSSYRTMWIGWPGIWVKPGKDREALTAMLHNEGYVPVWIDPTLLDLYYNGFCNSVIWQLFHYVPLNIDSWQRMAEHRTMQMQWQAYQVANQKFADVVLEYYEVGDIVWVQDYHLMLVASYLKTRLPKMKVGFFLHTPFPSSEIYRTLPVREEVLKAMLGADLIGFHTYDYARHFISSCTRILGLEGTPEGVEDNGTLTRVGTFPIGIDPERFTRALETEEVQMNIAKLLNRYAGRKIMLGVDRLDMIKGIPQKLLAYEKFLEEHPEWRDKVLLVQIAVPSRTDVPEYQKLRSMVHEIVGRINGQFGTLTYVPIHHLDRQLNFTELCALYAVTDVALVTSLRDGMNLVSYEFVACQSDNAGVLVLSEFAGAAQSLGAGAILVNPWNISDMSQAIEDALTMSEEERRERHRQNYMHVATHTAQNWADTFISELNDTHIEADLRMRHTPPPVCATLLELRETVAGYMQSQRRLLILGYNATLTTAVEAPRQPKRHFDQIMALAKVNPKVLSCIQELCADPNNVVLVFSGSDCDKLMETFQDLPVWLAAENGVFLRPPATKATPAPVWQHLWDGLHKEWMESVQLVFEYFCERTPRSFVEKRETSLVWNYKYADVEFGRLQARDLLQHLWTGPISNAPVEIIQGGKSVEVRPVGVTKGLAMQRSVAYMAEVYGAEYVKFDFVLCIGHLLARDENIYSYFEGIKVDGATGNPMSHQLQRMPHHTPSSSHGGPQGPLHALQGHLQEIAQDSKFSSHVNSAGPNSPRNSSTNALGKEDSSTLMGPPIHLNIHLNHSASGNANANLNQFSMSSATLSNAVAAAAAAAKEAQDKAAAAAASTTATGPPPSWQLVNDPGPSSGPATHHSTGPPRRDASLSTLAKENAAAAAGAAAGGAGTHYPLPLSPGGFGSYFQSLQAQNSAASLGGCSGTGSGNDVGAGGPGPRPQVKVASLWPPKYLFTCSVGRNRSKARYSLAGSSEVAELLEMIVQQGIHHMNPSPNSSMRGEDGGFNRDHSMPCSEPMSPDSTFGYLPQDWRMWRGVPMVQRQLGIMLPAGITKSSSMGTINSSG